MKTVVLFSSARENGNTGKAANQIAKRLNAELIYLDQFAIGRYSYTHSHRDDDFRQLLTKLIAFDHIVIASPIYWYSMTATLKCFFERVTEFMDDETLRPILRTWRGKAFSILSTSSGSDAPDCFVDSIRLTMEYLGLHLQSVEHVNCGQ
ncbi:flavodoxin family protein [Pseudoalteromonas xiamenensis]|uniref:NAD(P)H-dependent oxidoreductase n=1 Tax=Pseudoalteromonas xiamenensis TaxID=882626 RepID=A0A975HN29_9GAMM|nr:NAD(P)H-dependent oxidoreductase [Pseudoalteromonas xiamenensis]QTH73602.1 NAD(P)H-dependent oxidoreductase [Pseudoalteromonas xiamenensis]